MLYVLLGRAGAPTFYDKLLQVPVLNLSVILIDRAARSSVLRGFDPAAFGRSLAPPTLVPHHGELAWHPADEHTN